MHEANLRITYLEEKRKVIALNNNKILKMENASMKVKSVDTPKRMQQSKKTTS